MAKIENLGSHILQETAKNLEHQIAQIKHLIEERKRNLESLHKELIATEADLRNLNESIKKLNGEKNVTSKSKKA